MKGQRLLRVKDVTAMNKSSLAETTAPDYTFRYIDISNVSSNGEISLSEPMSFSSAPSRARRIVKKDDIIVSTVRTYLRAIGSIDWDAKDIIASTGFAVLSAKHSFYPKYLAYAFRSNIVIDSICKQSCGVSYPAINTSVLSSISLPVVDFNEQVKRASYLDAKLADISKAIAILVAKRDFYKSLKKSLIQEAVTKGIDHSPLEKKKEGWMGEMPCHWLVRRLKDVSVLYSGLTGKSGEDFRSDDFEGMKPYIPFTNILNNISVDFSQFKYVVMDSNEQQNVVREGDLLFLMSSEDYESIGKPSVVIGNPGEVYLNSFCRGLHFKEPSIDSRFVNYQLSSELFRNALRFEARGFTRINIKIDKIYSMSICLPPPAEQKRIADYLDERCAKIDSAIEIIDKQIAKYTELKKSLINEVITGKRVI